MSLEILPIDERAGDWRDLLAAMPARQRDVYFTPGYLQLWQRNGDGRAHGAVFTHGETLVLYPFLLRELDEVAWLGRDFAGLRDIQTPYGYGGPLVHKRGGDEHAVRLFRQAFHAWCREHGVVSEFVRFHPLLDTQLGMDPYLEVIKANTTVWCRVDTPTAERLQALSGSTRRGVRKAREAGLRVAVETSDECYARFAELYRDTMARRQATPYYFFSDRYFADARELLGDDQTLLCVWHGDEIVAGALFMRSPEFVHYHLGGSAAEALPLRPNNLLFFEAMQWGFGLGAAALHLGGGYQPDDDLFRFKSGFSPLRAQFCVGRAVHLPDEYERAAAARAAAAPVTDPHWFPAYRAPLPE
ncbi:MAG TPA: GNAT family N-acetyltransferase [Thermoleophilia bacterium]|nr:GNAT family N-acetyltransferase [Thermoleophilia bacterium]